MIYLVKPMFSVNDFRKLSIIIYVINAVFLNNSLNANYLSFKNCGSLSNAFMQSPRQYPLSNVFLCSEVLQHFLNYTWKKDFAALDHPVPRKKKHRKKLHQSRLISERHNACLCNHYNKRSVKNIISYACLSTKF